MAKSDNLRAAKAAKNDEFYTRLEDINNELYYYTTDREDLGIKNQFRDKIVFCNCDDPEWSNFWKYFKLNFKTAGIKKLISTHYSKEGTSYKLEYDGEDTIKTPLQGNGDFRSEECIKILQEADIIASNPPFSLFKEYIAQLIQYDKKFIIIGNMNAISYKEIFPHIKSNKIWTGVHSGSMKFRVPDTFDKDNVVEEDGVKYAKFGNICWFTNMDHYHLHEDLELNDFYNGNEEKYPKYDNYNAISVNKLDDIPCDYNEEMGVPITFLFHYNPSQFEIIGKSDTLAEEIEIDGKTKKNPGRFYVNGKRLFDRVVIKKKVRE